MSVIDDMIDRIERVARAICASKGLNPDAEVQAASPNAFANPRIVGSGVATVCYGPQWELYIKEAKTFIAAYDALQ